jgi:hypothetical protein
MFDVMLLSGGGGGGDGGNNAVASIGFSAFCTEDCTTGCAETGFNITFFFSSFCRCCVEKVWEVPPALDSLFERTGFPIAGSGSTKVPLLVETLFNVIFEWSCAFFASPAVPGVKFSTAATETHRASGVRAGTD